MSFRRVYNQFCFLINPIPPRLVWLLPHEKGLALIVSVVDNLVCNGTPIRNSRLPNPLSWTD